MIVLYEWRDLIENADYLIALQALAILQVSRRPNMHEKIYIWNACFIARPSSAEGTGQKGGFKYSKVS